MLRMQITQGGLALALSHLFKPAEAPVVQSLALALYSNGVELEGEGYARQPVSFDDVNDGVWAVSGPVNFGPGPQGSQPTEPANSARLWAHIVGEQPILVATGELDESTAITDQTGIPFVTGGIIVGDGENLIARRA